MKKFIFSLVILVIIGTVFFNLPVKAQDYRNDTLKQLSATAGTQGANYGPARDPRVIAAQVVKIFMGLLGTLFLAYTVYAGFLILISGGNEEKVTKGKKIIFYAALGAVVSFSTYGIVLFVQRYFVGETNGLNASTSYGAWYAQAGISVDQNTSQFYNSDPKQQDTQIFH